MCNQKSVHLHHVIYRQQLNRSKGDPKDERNLVSLCFSCHGAHHARSRVIPLTRLPDSVFVFAEELMGAGPAFNYLQRYYAGGDERLAMLLEAA
jgi:hypothetical protein